MRRFRSLLALAAVALVAVASSGVRSLGAAVGDDDATIVHVLNRTGFGPRPGDIEAVRRVGVVAYIDAQLHPERVADAAIAGRLAPFRTLGLSQEDLGRQFTLPLLAARRAQRQDTASSGRPDGPERPGQGGPNGMDGREIRQRAMTPMLELSQQKVLRAAYSERQLQEVLTDFWFNHFNVDARKGPERFLLTSYERDVIRPRVFGTFRELLGATAKSPAMLFYLDNWLSSRPVGENERARPAAGTRRPPARPGLAGARPSPGVQANRPRGLNENYARELMELHTLGVDGGYTQKDVTEVARALTGWTIDRPRTGTGQFRFDPRLHDPGDKVVLGHHITAGGMADGEAVLDLLAAHPSTARFIATKLARRFVSDNPPRALVERVAARFTATGGDLREVVRAILTSPEFFSPDAVRAKTKSPFEFVVSAVRVTGVDLPSAQPLVREVRDLGMPLYECQPPTGYRDTAEAWTTAGALVARMNFAQQLARLRLGPASGSASLDRVSDSPASRGDGPALADAAVPDGRLLGGLSESTRAIIERATTDAERLTLTLGSPEFQKR